MAMTSDRALRLVRVDLTRRHPLPSPVSLLLATGASVGGSLAADALLVWAGTNLFPSTRGYTHFQFSDYGLLTTVGVLIACAAWPMVTWVSWDPRWLFFRLAVAVTLVLWIPDIYLLTRHQPVRAVAVLMVMHLAIAAITYNALVRIAAAGATPPASTASDRSGPAPDRRGRAEPVDLSERSTDRLATCLALLVGIELVVGIAVVVSVPTGRPSGWVPTRGRAVYLVHALLGLLIALGAVVHFVRSRASTRIARLSGWIGSVGVAVAGAGGLLAAVHPLRLVGFACMLLGSIVAGFGYLLPALDRMTGEGPHD
jgi:hypothetical protein